MECSRAKFQTYIIDLQKHICEKSHPKKFEMTNLKIRKRRQERLRGHKSYIKNLLKLKNCHDLAFDKIFSEPKSPWSEKLVIDGGMGTELYALGAKEIYGSHQLWSAQANHASPELVTEAHRRYGYLTFSQRIIYLIMK